MATVTINGDDYDTYVSLAAAQAYLNAQFSADDWRAADADTQARGVVSATRLLDRLTWQGEPDATDQLHAFPRTGLTYPDGTPVDPATVPQRLLDACCELAGFLAGGSEVQTSITTDPNVRDLKAGSVQIGYFRLKQPGLRLPLPVQELIGPWLGAGAGFPLAMASGTDDCSEFTRPPNFNQSF